MSRKYIIWSMGIQGRIITMYKFFQRSILWTWNGTLWRDWTQTSYVCYWYSYVWISFPHTCNRFELQKSPWCSMPLPITIILQNAFLHTQITTMLILVDTLKGTYHIIFNMIPFLCLDSICGLFQCSLTTTYF